MRVYRTTQEAPLTRWAQDEQPLLITLAARPCTAALLPPAAPGAMSRPWPRILPVERRPLSSYSALLAESR